MKVVLFCGGLGLRMREYSDRIPKPMVPVGGLPILCHVMSYYSYYGHRDFVLCLGHKADVIKDYFTAREVRNRAAVATAAFGPDVGHPGMSTSGWNIDMIDTGVHQNIGERLVAARSKLDKEEIFLANYSDGFSNVRLDRAIEDFKASGKIACFVAVRPNLSYHFVDINDKGYVSGINPAKDSNIWINGGFFIFRRSIFDYIKPGEELVVEPFRRLIMADQLIAYRHTGFWASMDTLKDKQLLEDLFEKGQTPWLPWTTMAETGAAA